MIEKKHSPVAYFRLSIASKCLYFFKNFLQIESKLNMKIYNPTQPNIAFNDSFYNPNEKLNKLSYRFNYIILYLLLAIFFSCNRDKAFVEKGVEKEKIGKKAEALHLYTQAYKINPENSEANERLGFLLSESQFSTIPAIYHLENARNIDTENLKIALKLIDLTLFIGDFNKSKRIQREVLPSVNEAIYSYIVNITTCLEMKEIKDKKKITESLNPDFPKEIFFLSRSLSLCYETSGNYTAAEMIASKAKEALKTYP